MNAPPEHETRLRIVQAEAAAQGQSPADGDADTRIDRRFLSSEKIVWRWPYIEDAIVLEDTE